MGQALYGSIQANGTGSVAMGDAFNGSIQANGNGSAAIGNNVNAKANYSFALGKNSRTGIETYNNYEAKVVEYTNDYGGTVYKIVKASDR